MVLYCRKAGYNVTLTPVVKLDINKLCSPDQGYVSGTASPALSGTVSPAFSTAASPALTDPISPAVTLKPQDENSILTDCDETL